MVLGRLGISNWGFWIGFSPQSKIENTQRCTLYNAVNYIGRSPRAVKTAGKNGRI
jgi:hypothetical protein